MAEPYDVVIVGARCAGSPLAALLARDGLRVALVEQATFPRDTLSTHIIEADGLAFLDRLGVTDRLRATGAPFVMRADTRLGEVRIVRDWPVRPGDPAGIVSIRRHVLDPILAEAAEQAGADVRMGTKVKDVLRRDGRVAGVRVTAGGTEDELQARLVVGADGRNSTVAPLCGARKYNVTPNKRMGYYGYFRDADIGAEPTFVFHRWENRIVLGCPSDDGLYLVVMLPELTERDHFRADLEQSFLEYARSCEPVATAVAGGERAGKIYGIVRWTGFFRDAAGAGWALVGDAGHFKDPTAGRGISDAFCQVDALAPAIVEGLGRSEHALDATLAAWGRWRDREFADYYWFHTDLGDEGPVPVAVPELVRRLQKEGKEHLLLDIQSHRARPTDVLSPPRLLAAVGRALVRSRERLRLLRELALFAARDMQRRWRNRRSAYAENGAVADAGATEVDDPQVIAAA
jgi:2-polyprenyl-6-methoxyphenol hydroxylase-like FAD-dependent oxidoreductase